MNTDKILTGWNTWDTYSATTYVHMPEGYGVRIGLKEYLRGQYLQYPNIGRLGETDEKIRPGLHAYDGSYTELELEWRRIALKIQTAVRDDSLIIRIEPVSNTTRFIPSIVLEGVVLWNMPAVCRKDGQGIVWDAGGKTKRLQLISGTQNDDTYMPVSGPFVSIQIDQAVCFSIGEKYTPEQADEIIRENKEKMLTYASEKYKGYAQAWIGMQTSLAWNLIYDSKNKRPMINVSRLWNIDRGGYALFCWDNFFMGFMAAIDAPELGKNNIIENLKEVEELGFVPNGSFGNGRKSFDRSQPPVGTMCVWEVYKMDKDEEFLKEAFDLLLRWNRWWMEKRYNGGLLSWGSDDYDNKWEMDGIHETFGASLESGMDNSPMYIPEEVYFNPEKNILELWDVALNSMYIYDCEHLADIAGILGRNEEKELRERAEAFKKLFPRLWNDELGIYCNYKTDEQKFSTVLSPCNFYALMTGLPDDRQAERMMKEHFMNPEEFYGDWIMPSIARNHPMYPENTYWRGRIWAPLNFLVYMGMRRYEGLPETRILVDKSMELFMKEWTEHGHVHENYNSENGYGDDVLNSDRNYAWGGLLVLMTLMEEGRFRKQDGVYLQIHSKIGGVRIGKWTQGWLAYTPKADMGNGRLVQRTAITGFDKSNGIIANAVGELVYGIKKMLDIRMEITDEEKPENGILIRRQQEIPEGGWQIKEEHNILYLLASEETGVLYGVFHILRQIAMEKTLCGAEFICAPDNPLRMFNHWDNMDGSIERGYSGRSFFFRDNKVIVDERTRDYCRLVSSVGINGVVINNVNVNDAATWLITDKYLDRVKEIADIFAGYGIKLFLSLNFAASIELGGPDSADPLDEAVIEWWKAKIAEVYNKIPGLGGFLVKADSEGRPGPYTYGRTQADGANMLADIIKPYGGILIWRCFVYNCKQDWRDYKTDRARAAYDNFIGMDGDYHDNVILQIKNGPMDFQIREPVSPLLGGLTKTNQMLEVQIAQEYTGHQIDVCYLIPMFKEVLDFKTYCSPEKDTVADIASGRMMGNRNAGITAVCNTGDDENWTGSDLAAANLYGFGRLAYCTDLSAEEIAEEWIRQTFSNDREVVEIVSKILLGSREVYEKYTSPLGIGWMVTPGEHYGPSVDGYEYSRWGTYHRADHLGLGVDRTDSGTGYARQYYEPNASMYDNAETCPEELLLFFHHVLYTYRLKTGKTVIQHIYDSHFEGVEEVEGMIESWKRLEGKVDDKVFSAVIQRFDRQLDNAREWRDQVNTYFYRKSGIPDQKGRKIY